MKEEAKAWFEKNPWYKENAKAARYADSVANALRDAGDERVGVSFLESVTAKVAEVFPSIVNPEISHER